MSYKISLLRLHNTKILIALLFCVQYTTNRTTLSCAAVAAFERYYPITPSTPVANIHNQILYANRIRQWRKHLSRLTEKHKTRDSNASAFTDFNPLKGCSKPAADSNLVKGLTRLGHVVILQPLPLAEHDTEL